MNKYTKVKIDNNKWVITTFGKDYKKPVKACTFAIDTETQVYFDGKLLPQDLNKALLNEKKAIKLFQHLPENDDWYDVWQYSEWRLLGDIYMAMGNINEARQSYLKGKDKDSDCKERLEELKK